MKIDSIGIEVYWDDLTEEAKEKIIKVANAAGFEISIDIWSEIEYIAFGDIRNYEEDDND